MRTALVYCIFQIFFLSLLFSCDTRDIKDDPIVYPVKGHPAYENQLVQPYTLAIAEDPENPDHFLNRASALLNINCDSLAIIDLKRAITLDSIEVEYQIALGEILNNNHLPDEALTYFENALKVDPQIPAFLGKLKSLILLKKYQEAYQLVKFLDSKIYNHPDLKYLEFELLLDDKKDTSVVVQEMRRFLTEFPLALNIKMLLAEIEFETNDHLVVKTYSDLFRSDTLDVYPLERIGDYYRKNNKFHEAMSYYKKAVSHDWNYYYGFYKIGELYRDVDSLDKALNNYSLAKDINPAYANAYYGIAIIYKMKGNTDSFEAYKNIALRLNPKLIF